MSSPSSESKTEEVTSSKQPSHTAPSATTSSSSSSNNLPPDIDIPPDLAELLAADAEEFEAQFGSQEVNSCEKCMPLISLSHSHSPFSLSLSLVPRHH